MSVTAERIKLRMKEIKMTVDDLAPAIKKDRTTIYRYLNGNIENIPVNVLSAIATQLHTTPDYLMGWTDDPHGKETFDHALDREYTEYTNMLHHLTAAGFNEYETAYIAKYKVLEDKDKEIINAMIDRFTDANK